MNGIKWVLVLEGFKTDYKPGEALPISRRTVVSYDGPEKAVELLTKIIKGEVDPHGNEWKQSAP